MISALYLRALNVVVKCAVTALAALGTSSSAAQVPTFLSANGPAAGLVIPSSSGILGHTDSTALTELKASASAVGVSRWRGMQATGTLTYGVQDSAAYPATLWNAPGHRFRLDVQTPRGTESTRISGLLEKFRGANQQISTLDVDTALAGIFPFEIPYIAAGANAAPSVSDHGIVKVGDSMLHRVTFEFGTIGTNPNTHHRNTVPVDFYFDTVTHLLMKSATYGVLPGNNRTRFLIAVTYSDYRRVGLLLLPFRFTETIDGQVSRTLQLATVQINPAVDASYFTF